MKQTFIIGKQVQLPLKITGMQISAQESAFLTISQCDFNSNLQVKETTSEKRPLLHNEVNTLRGIAGKLHWCSGQTLPYICIDVKILVSDLTNVETDRLKTANKILKRIKYDNNYSKCYRNFAVTGKTAVFYWFSQLRHSKICGTESRRGDMSYMFMNYLVGAVTFLCWSSKQIRSVARSTLTVTSG